MQSRTTAWQRQAKRQRHSLRCKQQQAAAVAAISASERTRKSQLPTHISDDPPTDIEYDAVIVGSGMGGLSTATQLAASGAKVVVLEK